MIIFFFSKKERKTRIEEEEEIKQMSDLVRKQERSMHASLSPMIYLRFTHYFRVRASYLMMHYCHSPGMHRLQNAFRNGTIAQLTTIKAGRSLALIAFGIIDARLSSTIDTLVLIILINTHIRWCECEQPTARRT